MGTFLQVLCSLATKDQILLKNMQQLGLLPLLYKTREHSSLYISKYPNCDEFAIKHTQYHKKLFTSLLVLPAPCISQTCTVSIHKSNIIRCCTYKLSNGIQLYNTPWFGCGLLTDDVENLPNIFLKIKHTLLEHDYM